MARGKPTRGRASNRRSGGGKGLSSVFWPFLVIVIVVSFFRIPQHDSAQGVWAFFEGRARTLESWILGLDLEIEYPLNIPNGPTITLPTLPPQAPLVPPKSTPTPSAEPSPGATESQDSPAPETSAPTNSAENPDSGSYVINNIAEPQDVAYNRGDWSHWGRITSCWNVREEVLYRQAQEVVLLDANGEVTSNKAEACYVDSGTWLDPYTGQTFTDPSKLDIDHLIPLSYAAQHGGQEWDSSRKTGFANSLDDKQLIAVSASANRSKGAKGPADWYPANPDYECDYAIAWISVANQWDLSVSPADAQRLEEVVAGC